MHYSRTYFILSAILVVVASKIVLYNPVEEKDKKQDKKQDKKHDMITSCAPIHANIHDDLRCQELDGERYKFDSDCCAGSDSSGSPSLCANSFERTETDVCGQGHGWCDEHGCRHYECKRSTACVEYVGCYKDDPDKKTRDFPFKASSSDGGKWQELLAAVSACANQCRENKYAFAAVQGYGTCRCGDEYGNHGLADERLCGKDAGKPVAARCGDGDSQTCDGVNAVYRLTGEDKCCDYYEPEADADKAEFPMWIYFLGPIIGGSITFCMFVVFCGGGLGVYCCVIRPRERAKRAARAARAAANVAVVQPSTVPANAVVVQANAPVAVPSVAVVEPVVQKFDVSGPPVVIEATDVHPML